ncbi:glycosyl transferase [Rhodococcus hoagii]|nr:glycosyl transferase [Prescottella equi]NKZ92839.1 glycosyl transferase [Prescottella equi]
MSVTIDRPVAAPEPAAAPKRTREYWALAALLVGTAVAYLWNLGASGWANAFYSAAVQAGSVSWKAFFFGSSDAANSITVDKPPASLWVMELSVRVFGLNSWSILVPQVLTGVASVALLWATVRRYFGAAAGLLAGLVLALTPVAVLMFRFDNPDALLVLSMIAAVWATLRAVEDGRTRWMVLTGVFVGLGFLTKQLQVMLVVPPLALTYLIAGPPKIGKRILQLSAALGGAIVSAGWWLLTVELWPADSRPWIGGSQNNSILELTLGYNGFGRLNGNERGSVGGGGPRGGFPGGDTVPGAAPGGGMWGSTGITRLFEPAQGGQIAWLLPAALVLLVAGIGRCGRSPRTDPRRASFVVWGAWLLVMGLVFSFMAGIFHAYYTVALAPAVAALVGAGAVTLWRGRRRWWVRIVAFAAITVTASTAWILLARSPDFVPWLRWAVVVVGAVAAFSMVVPRVLRTRGVVIVIAATLFTGLAGPAAYAVNTIGTAHTGSIPSAGPRVEGEMGRGGPGGMRGPGEQRNGVPTPGGRGNGEGAFGMPGVPGGFGGAGGGLLDAGEPGDELTALLRERADDYTWVAAATGSNSAAGFQLATERPVMPIGGFNGSDPSPTLEQFQQFVADGRIHYFLAGGMGGRGGEGTASAISEWVQANFASTTVDGVVLYDLTQ